MTRTLAAPRRTARRPALLALAVAALVVLATACTPEQQAVYGKVNATRLAAGAPELAPSPHAMDKAQAWADHLARTGTLGHSRLAEGMPQGWLRLGENVGRGPSIDAVYEGFLQSAPHRANLLNSEYNWVGTGVATTTDGNVVVVQVFARY